MVSPTETSVPRRSSATCSTAPTVQVLLDQLEGGVFLSVGTLQIGNAIMVCQDRYTVCDGVVHEIKCGKVTPTGDAIEEMFSLERVGEFNPTAKYDDIGAVTLSREAFVRAICP